MSTRPCIAGVFYVVAAVCAGATTVAAQTESLDAAARRIAAQTESLDEVARRTAEERQAQGPTARLYTDADLKAPRPSRTSRTPAAVTPRAADAPASAADAAHDDIEPARLITGSMPQIQPMTVSGGDVRLSVAVSSMGTVGAIDVLRTTPVLTDAIVAAVRAWRFSPALDSKGKAMDTHVFISALIGAPTLGGVPAVGTPPKDVAPLDPRVPFPAQTSPPLYPVNAMFAGTVLVEARVDPRGHVVGATVVRSAPPFDGPALEAATAWTFRPVTDASAPPSPYVYLLFVFRHAVFDLSVP